ncbi:hypothetical protein EDB83DRAFT_2410518, partial [Lactarius deliciosus]
SQSLLIALAAWLCRFHFDLLRIENAQLSNELSAIAIIFKRDKAESFRPARLVVHHYRGVTTFPYLQKNASAVECGANLPTKYRVLRGCS